MPAFDVPKFYFQFLEQDVVMLHKKTKLVAPERFFQNILMLIFPGVRKNATERRHDPYRSGGKQTLSPFHLLMVLVLMVLASCFLAYGADAEERAYQPERRPLPLDVVAGQKNLGPVAVAPDGRWLVYGIRDPGRGEVLDRPYTGIFFTSTGALKTFECKDLWAMNIATRQSIRITDGRSSNGSPIWSPDGKQLAFLSDRDGRLRVWVWDRDTESLRRVSDVVVKPSTSGNHLIWTPDGRKLLTQPLAKHLTDRSVDEILNSPTPFIKPQESRKPGGPHVTVYSALADDKASSIPNAGLNYFTVDIGLIDVESGKLERVKSGVQVFDISLSSDGGTIEYTTPEGRETMALGNVSSQGIAPFQDRYTVSNNAVWKAGPNYKTSTRVGHVKSRRIKAIVKDFSGLSASIDQDTALIVHTINDVNKQEGLYRLDLATGEARRLIEGDQRFGAMTLLPDGELIYTAQNSQHDLNLWISELSFTNPRQLTHVNPAFENYVMGKSRLIKYQSATGRNLKGALLLPANYEAGKSYPLVVMVYAGMNGSDYKNTFGIWGAQAEFNMQVYATRGYAVLFPDVPVSVGTVVKDLADAVLPAVDKVVALGIADPERLAITGHSYGGYNVRALIARTTQFKAAVSSSGMTGDLTLASNHMNLDGTDTQGYFTNGQGSMGGSFWSFKDRYFQNSPFFFYDKVKTPLLMKHGMNDAGPTIWDRTDFVALRTLGVDVQMLWYIGDGHTIQTYANQLDFWQRKLNWLDRYLTVSPHAE